MKKSKSVLLILAGICALLILSVILMHAWLPGFLSEKIEDEIRTGLNPESIELYEVEAGASSFSTFFKTTRISEIKLVPNDTTIHETDAELLPGQIFEAKVQDLKISSWTLVSLAMGWKDIKVKLLSADSIFLAIYTNESGTTAKDSSQKRKLEHLYLENISTNQLRIEKRTLTDTARQVFQTGKVDFNATVSFQGKEQDNFINPGIEMHSLKVLEAGSYSSRGLYTFHVDSVFFDDTGYTADLKGIKVSPRYSKEDFHKHVLFETDRFDTRLDHITISGIQPNRAIEDGSIVLSQIKMNGGKLEVFRDRRPPFDKSQRPLLPARLIQEAPFGLFAGEILLNKIDIVYQGLLEGSDTAGEIAFKQVNATINNISNLKDSLASDSIMSIRAEALIFAEARLQVEFKYKLTDPGGGFEAKGELAKLNFTDVNTALYPLTGLQVIDGMHQATSFYFYGNDIRSAGELRMRYSGLEIELLPDGSKLFKGLARFVGRNILYYPDNPAGNKEVRVGKIEFDRDNTRFVFNYWWKSYLSGIKDCVLKEYFNW